jgi:hypothetical protein
LHPTQTRKTKLQNISFGHPFPSTLVAHFIHSLTPKEEAMLALRRATQPKLRALICFVVMALMLPATSMQATNKPIPGIDIVVKKHPGYPPTLVVVASSDAQGHFTAKITEAGQYTLSLACKKPPCAKFTAVISADGKVLKANADGTYEIVVESKKPVTVTGEIATVDTTTKLPTPK